MRYNEETLRDVLSDFIYSSAYWIDSAKTIFPENAEQKTEYPDSTERMVDCLKKGGSIKLYTEDGNYHMTLKSLVHGVSMAKKKFGSPDNWDSIITDIAIQYAVFDEIVYG